MDVKIEFIEEGHKYLYNGKEASISITRLLAKHGLSPNYKNVDKEVLGKAAKRGTEHHKELECIIKDKTFDPITEQGANYKLWYEKNVDCGVAEIPLGIEYKGVILCGTADDFLILKNGEYTIDDHKFNRELHKEAVRWQTSLIKWILKQHNILGNTINGKSYKGFINPKLNVDFFKTGQTDFERIELEPIEDSEIVALLDAEANGEIYKPKQAILDITKEEEKALIELEVEIARIELQAKALKKRKDDLRAKIRDTFIKQKVKSWISPNEIVKYTLVDEVNSVELDTAKMKLAEPELYAKLIQSYPKHKTTNAYVKASVDIDKYNDVKEVEAEIKMLEVK